MVVARCVIFDEVHDENNGKTYRLAERQYSTEGSETLKQVLVNKLIDAGDLFFFIISQVFRKVKGFIYPLLFSVPCGELPHLSSLHFGISPDTQLH